MRLYVPITAHTNETPRNASFSGFFVLCCRILLLATVQPLTDDIIKEICDNTCCNGNKN